MKKSDENIAGFFRWTTQPNLLSINYIYSFGVVYIRKVKKSESKSQRNSFLLVRCCVYPVKLKNLKANHNIRERAPQK